jgi:glycosyltransferase involved in cell wall biosynthesis
MRVLFCATRLSGGAGIACRRIWEAFREFKKVEVATIVYRQDADLWTTSWSKSSGKTTNQNCYKHHSQWINESLSVYLNDERSDFSATYLSAHPSESPYDDALINLFDAHDVINMHWVAGLFSIKSMRHLRDTRKPVLITLHDQNHFTGVCHYSAGCRLFTHHCSDCQQLLSKNAKALAEEQYRIKQAILGSPNFYWTGPSDWIVEEAARSSIPFSRKNILKSLKNPVVDDASCSQVETDAIISKFNPCDKRIALVADNLNDPRKGIAIGIESIALALSDKAHKLGSVEIHLIGSSNSIDTVMHESIAKYARNSKQKITVSVVSHGRVPSHHLAIILRKVDILVFPSIEENYSNLLIEALEQGTSIIALAVGGNREIALNYPELMKTVGANLNIKNGINGKDNDRLEHCVSMLSRLICSRLKEGDNRKKSAEVIKRCKHNHGRSAVANSYLASINSIVKLNTDYSKFPADAWDKFALANPTQHTKMSMRHARGTINNSEPVFWLGTNNDLSIELTESEILLIITLNPSWEEDYIFKRLDHAHWHWKEFPLFNHSSFQMPELQYWDLVAITATRQPNDSSTSNRLLLPTSEQETALPILLEAVIPTSAEGYQKQSWSRLSDLLWQPILGDCIVPPMKGLSCYPSDVDLNDPISIKQINEGKRAERHKVMLSHFTLNAINVEEPVFWLGADVFNDFEEKSEICLLGCALYPSWETDYINNITTQYTNIKILSEIDHTTAQLDELKFWNTIVFQVTCNKFDHFFNAESDPQHCLPLLYLGVEDEGERSPGLSLHDLQGKARTLQTVVPIMAGFDRIISSLS